MGDKPVTLGLAAIFAAVIAGYGWCGCYGGDEGDFHPRSAKRTLGGQTGDTLGAAIELGELVFLLALL